MTDALRDPGPMARWQVERDEAGLMEMVVQRVAEGETPQEICRSRKWPYSLFAQWIIEDVGRTEMLARATKFWVDALARSTAKIARDAGGKEATKAGLASAKLEIDTYLRLASKLDRGQYGDAPSVALSIDNRVMPDRETMVLETARAFAYVLAAGAEIADRKPQQIAAPVEAETVAPVATVPDAGLI